jgi:hypothetical protein
MDISLPGAIRARAVVREIQCSPLSDAIVVRGDTLLAARLLPDSASAEPRIWLALKDAKLEILREHEIPSVTDPPKPAVPVRGVRPGSTSQSRQSVVDASPYHTRSSLFLSTELQNGHSHLPTFVGDEYRR